MRPGAGVIKTNVKDTGKPLIGARHHAVGVIETPPAGIKIK
jgi:hypothetical protein